MKSIKPLTIFIALGLMISGCQPQVTVAPNDPAAPTQAMTETVSGLPTPEALPILETASGLATQQTTQTLSSEEQGDRPVRAIILFIGDGMGPVHRLGAQWLALGQDELLAMDNMPVRGMMKTSSANEAITDSAASATAMACGVKTNNQVLGMGPDYVPVETILEQAQARGWATGLITTVPMAHATPAAFAAHISYRYRYADIAKQMMTAGVDVLLGGGEDDFLPYGVKGCYPGNGNRGDKLNLVEQAVNEGYTYVCTGAELLGVDTGNTSKLVGFFGDDEMKMPFNPSLADMTRVAIEILSQDPDGFFLMVEGGQIDWEAEDNHALETMKLTVGFNAAVTMAQVYAVGEPNSLIIVTADHETGGMSLNRDCAGSFRQDGPYKMPDDTEFCVDWETGGHSGVDVPVTAQGPWSWMLYGEYPNTWVHRVMYTALTGEGFGGAGP